MYAFRLDIHYTLIWDMTCEVAMSGVKSHDPVLLYYFTIVIIFIFIFICCLFFMEGVYLLFLIITKIYDKIRSCF